MRASGGVAHRSEQAAHNRLVVGSTPTTPTNLTSQIFSVIIFIMRTPEDPNAKGSAQAPPEMTAIARAVLTATSRRKMSELVAVGYAGYNQLPKPVESRFGIFGVRYDYHHGCSPVEQLGAGIGLIRFSVKDQEDKILLFEIGKLPGEEADDLYQITGYDPTKSGNGLIVRSSVSEANMPPVIAITGGVGGYTLDDILPKAMHPEGLDISVFQVDAIQGFSPEGRHP